MVVRDLRSRIVVHEPPSVARNGRDPNVNPNRHITEEEPAADQGLSRVAGRTTHDRRVGGVEAERSGGKTIRDEVHPEELNGNERLGHAEEDSQEDATIISSVGVESGGEGRT